MTLWLLQPDLCPLQLFESPRFRVLMNRWGATPPNNARGQNLCLTVCKITGTDFSKITPSINMFDKWKCLYCSTEYDIYIRFLNLHKFWLMFHEPGKYRKKAKTNSRCWVDMIWFYDTLHNDNGTQHLQLNKSQGTAPERALVQWLGPYADCSAYPSCCSISVW